MMKGNQGKEETELRNVWKNCSFKIHVRKIQGREELFF